MMTPGPTEPTAEQLQNYIALLVDDLIELYENGVVMKTPSHPEGKLDISLTCATAHTQAILKGQLVRVTLLGIICDHPAMCKMCGFADKLHNEVPCTKCVVPFVHLFNDECLQGRECLFCPSLWACHQPEATATDHLL